MATEIREPTYFLLTTLLGGPLHGYAIAQKALELSDGRVRLSAGTLYGALDRLISQGFLREVGDELVSGRKRRSYSLTDDGRTALLDEAARMRGAAELVESRRVASVALGLCSLEPKSSGRFEGQMLGFLIRFPPSSPGSTSDPRSNI